MSIPFTGSGSLFVRLGHIFAGMLDFNSLVGAAINSTRVTSSANFANRCLATIQGDFSNGTAIPQVVAGVPNILSTVQNAAASVESAFGGGGAVAQNCLVAMYNQDVRGVPNTAPLATLAALPTGGLSAVLTELIRQMNAGSASIQSATTSIGAQTDVGTPTGNPVIVGTLTNGQGLTLQMVLPETLNFKTTADAQTGGRTAGNEQVTCYGQLAQTNPLSYLWPAGSGVTVPLSCVNGAANNAQGNKLQNSDWTTFTTANAPDNWPIIVGTAGTTIFNGGSGNAYTTSGGSLQFTGDGGGTLSSVAQPFNTTPSTALGAGGTSATLLPDTVYHWNIFYKVSATPSVGKFQVCLLDGTNTIINDDAGNANSTIQALTAATTSYANLSGTFRTPRVLPSTVKVCVRLATGFPIDSGKSVYFGRFGFTAPTQIYAGGPYFSIFSGNVNTINGPTPDAWTVAIANSYATTGSGLMALFMDRTFGLRTLGLQLPYSGSPTIADSLIT